MATRKRSSKLRTRPGARKKSSAPRGTASKQIARTGSTNSRQAAKSSARSPANGSSPGGRRTPIRAWNEVEIDEQRENAGRPEPAFLPEPEMAQDDLAEELGEEFVLTATSGEQAAEDIRNEDVPEELGGPFVETSGRTEFAYGTDPSNPEDAEPAAFPSASSLEPAVNPIDAESESGEASS